jgi:hypothetical protein
MNAGTATETTLGDNTVTMYVNSNGHQFYNISDKDAIDTWYNTYGIADFYGVDTENERVFLPRGLHGELIKSYTDGTNGYRIYSDGWCEQWGKSSNTSSLIQVTLPKTYINTNYNITTCANPVDGRTSYSNEVPYVNNITENSFKIWTMTGNSAKGSFWKTSGYLAENQYATPIRLIYYVVGTTTNYEGMTDVVSQGKTILEQVNEGLESKADLDAQNLSSAGASYISGLSAPSDRYISLTLGSSGDTYTAPANGWYLLNGTTTNATNYLSLENVTQHVANMASRYTNAVGIKTCLYVGKGQSVSIGYQNVTLTSFTFTYAEGAQND